jgi:eukaryotic-like serine/threonine-protein kinase
MNPIGRLASEERARRLAETVELYRMLPSFLSGTAKPVNAAQSTALAQILSENKLKGSSARFWEDAFKAEPSLAEDMYVASRYNVACAAALAGCGHGRDNPPLDEATKTHWRGQALDWLKADLAAWSRIITGSQSQIRDRAPQILQHWKADADLGGLRDEPELAKLPADEQKACRALWAEVDALLAKFPGAKPASGH